VSSAANSVRAATGWSNELQSLAPSPGHPDRERVSVEPPAQLEVSGTTDKIGQIGQKNSVNLRKKFAAVTTGLRQASSICFLF